MGQYAIRRLWLYFRYGHSTYFAFILSFVNFILLAYRFLIEPNSDDFGIFNSLTNFAMVFLLIYIPVSIIIGHWHRSTQLKVEADIKFTRNVLLARAMKTLIGLKLESATAEEISAIEDELDKIAKKSTISTEKKKE